MQLNIYKKLGTCVCIYIYIYMYVQKLSKNHYLFVFVFHEKWQGGSHRRRKVAPKLIANSRIVYEERGPGLAISFFVQGYFFFCPGLAKPSNFQYHKNGRWGRFNNIITYNSFIFVMNYIFIPQNLMLTIDHLKLLGQLRPPPHTFYYSEILSSSSLSLYRLV